MRNPEFTPPIWLKPDGSILSCVEKIKVLNEDFHEIEQLAQDTLDDAVLMGGTAAQVRQALHDLVDGLVAGYEEQQ